MTFDLEHLFFVCYNYVICQKLVDIIGGEVVQSTPVCVIMRLRDIQATILQTHNLSPLALPLC